MDSGRDVFVQHKSCKCITVFFVLLIQRALNITSLGVVLKLTILMRKKTNEIIIPGLG